MQERFEGNNTTSFMDTRDWIALLEKEGELRRITAEVDWNREIGAIARRVLEKKGPALLFENIKGYRSGRCKKLFVSGLGARSRLAMAPISRSQSTSEVIRRSSPSFSSRAIHSRISMKLIVHSLPSAIGVDGNV